MTDCPASTGTLIATGDVALLYRLFLGRAPEDPARVEDNLGRPLEDLAHAFIGSAEFAARLARMERGQPPEPAPEEEKEDLPAALDLLSRLVGPLPGDPAPRSLRAVLRLALSSAALWPAFTRHFGNRAIPLLEALGADAPMVAEADWQGYIDFASDWLVRGWACRRHDPAPVRLGVLVDGRMVARVEASLFRPDVAEQTGLARRRSV